MRNWVLAVSILILPSALLAGSSRGYSRAARATSGGVSFRGSSGLVNRAQPAQHSIQANVARVVSAANANPLLANPTTVSLAARASAIQTLAANAWRSFFPAPRALNGRSGSGGFNNGSMRSRSYGARRADDPPAPAPQTPAPQTPAPQTESIPPYLYTPGALIRTEGLGYKATPTNDAHWQNNDLGYAIVQDPSQTVTLDPFPGVHKGPADKLPPANAGSGKASGANAITANAVPSEGY